MARISSPSFHSIPCIFHLLLQLFLLQNWPLECFGTPILPLSPRFLHFSVQIRPEWWMDMDTKVLAIFESAASGPNAWQMAVQLFANHPRQTMPFSTLLNSTKGIKAIRAEQMGECAVDAEGTKAIGLEVELTPQFIFVRAKNAAKYSLPYPLQGSADLRVFFVLVKKHPEGGKEQQCQLNSELDFKQTSRFVLPSTTPHAPLEPTSSSSTSSSTTTTTPSSTTLPSSTTTTIPTTSSSSTTTTGSSSTTTPTTSSTSTKAPTPTSFLPFDFDMPTEKAAWPPYKRKRVKVPRRSTMAAQRFLGPNHYVPQQGRNKQRMFPPRPSTVGWAFEQFGQQRTTSTQASYIDIIRDRQLYEEVQRSRTMEINSRWSSIFLLFMGLIAVLIAASGAFALVMFVLLQCRPKPKSLLI